MRVEPYHLEALHRFAKDHGRSWKAKLRSCWERHNYTDARSEDRPFLAELRNRVSANWLIKYRLPKS